MDATLQQHVDEALAHARAAMAAGDLDAAWAHLERAHILGQRGAWPHVRAHWLMLAWGVRRRSPIEVFGQLIRLALAAPASWLGTYPTGNTGGASVSMFKPMPIPPDLQRLLDPEPPSAAP